MIMPVLYPSSATHKSDSVKLGRETDFVLAPEDPIEIPYGQKLFVLDEDRSVGDPRHPVAAIRRLGPTTMIYDEGPVCPFAKIC